MAGSVAGSNPSSTNKPIEQPSQEMSASNSGVDNGMNSVYQDRYIDEFSGMIPDEVKEVKTQNGEMKLTAIYPNGKLGHFEGMELIGKFIKTPEYRQFLERKLGGQ